MIVIMAVSAMMIAPSYFSATRASLDDEAKRLVQVLRLAQEEAALSGRNYRIRFRQHSYSFQSIARGGKWQTLHGSPYGRRALKDGIHIVAIRPEPPLSDSSRDSSTNSDASNNPDQEKEPLLAELLIPVEGIHQVADIVLAAPADGGETERIVAFHPGPGGIQIKQAAP